MSGSTPPGTARPQVQVDPNMAAKRQSTHANSPQSAIIDVPPGWGDSPASGSGRGSMDIDHARRSIEATSSSYSSPSQVSRSSTSNDEISPYSNLVRAQAQPEDPFATQSFSEDPFAQNLSESSPSDDGQSSRHNSMTSDSGMEPQPSGVPDQAYLEGRRGSMVFVPHTSRSITDPIRDDGHPVDPELTGQGHQQNDGYDFEHPQPPAFTRTFSAPLPMRVGFLRHPLIPLKDPVAGYNDHPHSRSRESSISSVLSPPGSSVPTARPLVSTVPSSSDSGSSERLRTPLETVSLELADGLQSAIQTLLHLSPPHLLDNAKEQYSGCTVQVPSTSLSALMSSMRGLNYLSANARALCEDAAISGQDSVFGLSNKREDFDIGELLQSVADLLCGQAAQAGVDFVLFHGDVGIKHVSVQGSAEGLAYALGHVVRQVLLVAQPGDTIELGLQVVPQSPSLTPRVSLPLTADDVDMHRRRDRGSNNRSSSPGRTLPSPPAGHANGPLLCIFEVVHNINQIPGSAAATPKAELNPFTRLNEQAEAAKPNFDTVLCRRLLTHQNASLKVDAQPSSPLGSGMPRRAYELSVLLPRGGPMVEPAVLSTEEEAMRQPFAGMKLAREPTLGELSDFAEALRGKKVTLHASLTSLFARHLTSYLAAWGLDISHIPIEDAQGESLPNFGAPPLSVGSYRTTSLDEAQAASKEDGNFVIIDDDVAVLRRELNRIRLESSPVLSFKPRLLKRPTLANRTRSTPQVRSAPLPQPGAPVIIHFTSLAKYNHVRDTISSLLGSSSPLNSAFAHPEVIVIPKPVGPRRFLTALHTAASRPIVDPFFSPIATSPRSPGGGYFPARTPGLSDLGKDNEFFETLTDEDPTLLGQRNVSDSSTGSQKARSPLGEFPPSQASVVRTDAGLHLSIPTPGEVMATPAHEYFESAVSRASSASGSAVIMQSPDGRPMGMFFEPPNRENRRVSYNRRTSNTRKPTSRRTSGAGPVDGQDQTNSPRTQNQSRQSNEDSSRRGSAKETPTLSRAASRRRTLPTPTAGTSEPILAMGRDRSSTTTSRSSRDLQVMSPTKVVGPGSKDPAGQATTPKTKVSKPTGMSAISDAKPAAKSKPATSAKKTGQDSVVPPINVLIVEDNPINQNILSMFLRKKKINHQTAKDGLEAVEKWRTGAFHLILMDIQLPVMDGIEATKEIRKLEKMNNIGVFPSTPMTEQPMPLTREVNEAAPSSPFRSSVIIVALTASSLQSDRVVALAAGCNDFLTKPVSLKWLERKIIEWGCMQALIDFEGWKRWKGTDKENTKQGFQVGPLRAARDLAGKLHIDRKGTKTPPLNAMSRSSSATRPEIQVRSATPQSSLDAATSPTTDQSPAAGSLSAARNNLVGRLPSPGPDSASSVVPSTNDTASTINQLQSLSLTSTSPPKRSSQSPSGSRPTTPRPDSRLSNSSSLRSIHEVLEPAGNDECEENSRSGSPYDKPLPALPPGEG